MITRQTVIRLAGLALAASLAAGCASTTAAKAPAAPASSSAPAASTFTDPNGVECASSGSGGYCPGDEPSASATPTDDAFNLPMGTPATLTDDSNGAEWTVTLNSVHAYHQGQYDDPAPAGTHYININVTYDVTTGPVDMNEWDWTAKDSNGTVYQVQYVAGDSNALSANTIQAGKTRGTVVLAITNGSAGTVVYSAGGSEQASWSFTAAQAAS